MLGIKQFVLAVNKIDLTNYDRAGFDKITHEFKEFALSLGVKQITAIPMSALKGENVVYSGQAAMTCPGSATTPRVVEICSRIASRNSWIPVGFS